MEDSLHYRFHIRLSNDGTAQPQEVHCTPERIKEIERCSILLRQRIKDAGNCGVILLETDDEANINLDVFRYLIRDLPLEPGADPGLVKLDVLSKYCNAFWKYQWLPESASILWEHLDRSGLEAQIQRVTSPERCWRQQTSPESQKNSLYLINIAIVFGLYESLRETMDKEIRQHIQTAIWDSNPDAQLKTSVLFLKTREDMRREELEVVFIHFYHYLVRLSKNYPRNVAQVRNRLKTEMEVDFYQNWTSNTKDGGRLTTYSVYEFVGKLEDIIIGPHESSAREASPHMHKVANVKQKPKGPPVVNWGGAAITTTKDAVALGKYVLSFLLGFQGQKWKSEILEMFNSAQDLIRERQVIRANEMIKRRKAELEKWEKALKDGQDIV